MQPSSKTRVLSIFLLAMLNVAIMASLRNLPLVASYELSAVFFFALVALFFLVPLSLVSAELATGWPKDGGVYIWVKEAFGEKWGFFAIWMQWVHNVAWYPVILSFVATTFAYVVAPHLATHKGYILTVTLVGYWSMTIINLLGIKTSTIFSTLGVILGTILPGLFIISLGCSWFFIGNTSEIRWGWNEVLPTSWELPNLVFLAGLFLAFAGLEVSASYAGEVKNPQKNFPRAILLAALITFFIFMLGALSIASVIPKEKINLVAGLMDAFKIFLDNYHLGGLIPVMGILLIIGAIAEVNAWIGGPVKGLHATAERGNLPPIFQKLGKHGMPNNLLILQAVIVTLAALVILHMPTVSASYWILSALSAQTYLQMYLIMFAAAIKLRYSAPLVPRTYRVPYKMKGMWIIAGTGFCATLFGFLIGFVPPASLQVGNILFYVGFLLLWNIVLATIPFCIQAMKKKKWQPQILNDTNSN